MKARIDWSSAVDHLKINAQRDAGRAIAWTIRFRSPVTATGTQSLPIRNLHKQKTHHRQYNSANLRSGDFSVLIYDCAWFEGFLVCRFVVWCVIRFTSAGGKLPRELVNKSGDLEGAWSFRNLFHSMDVFSMMMIFWHQSTKTQAHLAANKLL